MTALAGLPDVEGRKLAVPHAGEFIADFKTGFQMQTRAAHESLHGSDSLVSAAGAFADAGLHVEQEKIAEVPGDGGEGSSRPRQSHAVHLAQVGSQRMTGAFAQAVVEPLDVFVAARMTVFEASIAQESGEVSIAGCSLAGDESAGIIRCPEIGPGLGDVLDGEETLKSAEPAVSVPGTHSPAVILKI